MVPLPRAPSSLRRAARPPGSCGTAPRPRPCGSGQPKLVSEDLVASATAPGPSSSPPPSSLDSLDALLDADPSDAVPDRRRPLVASQDAAPRTTFLNPGRQTGRFINELVLRSDVAAGRATRPGEAVDLPRGSGWLAAGAAIAAAAAAAGAVDPSSSRGDALAAALLLAALGTEAEAVFGSACALAVFGASTAFGVAAASLLAGAQQWPGLYGAVGLSAAAAASAATNGDLPWLLLLTSNAQQESNNVRWTVVCGVVAASATVDVAAGGGFTTGATPALGAAAVSGYALGAALCPRWQLQRDVQLEDGAMSLPMEATLLSGRSSSSVVVAAGAESDEASGRSEGLAAAEASAAAAAAAAAGVSAQTATSKRTPLQVVVVAVDRRGAWERGLAIAIAMAIVGVLSAIGFFFS
jgi:hypothetical protein